VGLLLPAPLSSTISQLGNIWYKGDWYGTYQLMCTCISAQIPYPYTSILITRNQFALVGVYDHVVYRRFMVELTSNYWSPNKWRMNKKFLNQVTVNIYKYTPGIPYFQMSILTTSEHPPTLSMESCGCDVAIMVAKLGYLEKHGGGGDYHICLTFEVVIEERRYLQVSDYCY
jgi:hypothetical protein